MVQYGVNTFSLPAAIAFVLSAINLFWAYSRFEESIPADQLGKKNARPRFAAFYGKESSGSIRVISIAYFLFLTSFSGMEFTLTFLANDRLGWGPEDMGYLFVYIGLIIAVVQGGVVRKLAPRLGEKRVALAGIVLTTSGLLGVASSTTPTALYLNLAPLAIGSALTMPTMTALVSLLAAKEVQGAVLGAFRSAGALARVIGPISAAILYWKYGSEFPYWIGWGSLLLPLLLLLKVKQPSKIAEAQEEAG